MTGTVAPTLKTCKGTSRFENELVKTEVVNNEPQIHDKTESVERSAPFISYRTDLSDSD